MFRTSILIALPLMLSAQDKPLSQVMQPFYKYSQSGEINFQVEDKDGKIRELGEAYKQGKVDYLDGITIDLRGDKGGDWWFNVRKSNTEPMLRLNLEAANAAKVAERRPGQLDVRLDNGPKRRA